jgi:peptide/nickel transport system ATP-binding protein
VSATLLSVEGLGISFGGLPVTQDVTFAIAPCERVGMVGESGCGKSVTGLALLRLLPRTAQLTGRVLFEGRDVLRLSSRDLRRVRGGRIGMIFQEPMSALDPVFTIGEQIAETLRTHRGMGRAAAAERAVAVLDSVGIPLPRRRAESYPHQLSGGMRQRAMIAIALACEPALLIADEPTTALDVTVQAQIVDLLISLSDRMGTALLFITHDLGVIAEACTRVLTLYAGQVVEDAPAETLLTRPRHPYTSGLLRSLPRLSQRKARLPSIPGRVPPPTAMPPGCRFAPRCPHARDCCAAPQVLTGGARCCRQAELVLQGAAA